ncbi:ECF RNA polymerase sigma factor SigK [Actinokineospora sp.]|uniref:ECF RNA polymerase sigma factor SigK n=1 Tax=Actinokineospora sp. TaxID=1872133 RepID=UPI004037B403
MTAEAARRAAVWNEVDARTPDELLVAVALGDRVAFAALYERLAPAVLGMARAVVRDHAQAQEVSQEVFIDLWRTAARYRPDRGSALTWVMTMAHHRAVDRVRSAQTRVERERAVVFEPSRARPYDQVAETVIENWERLRVRDCLRTLTDLQRESIELAYYQAHTYREVAEILDVPPGTVKTRMRAGLLRLRGCLEVTP